MRTEAPLEANRRRQEWILPSVNRSRAVIAQLTEALHVVLKHFVRVVLAQ